MGVRGSVKSNFFSRHLNPFRKQAHWQDRRIPASSCGCDLSNRGHGKDGLAVCAEWGLGARARGVPKLSLRRCSFFFDFVRVVFVYTAVRHGVLVTRTLYGAERSELFETICINSDPVLLRGCERSGAQRAVHDDER